MSIFIFVLAVATSPSPQQDFYSHVNQAWLSSTTIPDDRSRWGAFDQLDLNVQTLLQELAEDAAAHPDDAIRTQVGRYYRAGMDVDAIEALGITPLKPWLERVGLAYDAASLAAAVGELHRLGVNVLFGLGAAPDAKDSTTMIAQLPQGGLGLPERDYYFAPELADVRDSYVTHVGHMLALAEVADSAAAAAAVLQLETALAEASLTAVERRDPLATYNKRLGAQLREEFPGFSWDAYFAAAELPTADELAFNVESTRFLARVATLVSETPVSTWRAYLKWHLLHRAAPYLGDAFVQENFSFYGQKLSGTPALQPRARRVVGALDTYLGEALGQLYVQRAFSAAVKGQVRELVTRLQEALGQRLRTLEWMGPQTRARALEKLAKLRVKVGYPDRWIDYSRIALDGSYIENTLRATAFAHGRMVAQLGKQVDPVLWEMTPQTVNAYYNPQTNEIVFPAAILQPPFFDPTADLASNYGGIGGVIGHELTHGYDDQGRLFDADGNLQDWWTAEDASRFDAQRAHIVSQFDGYRFYKQQVNGALTQGENIADLGGVKIALNALHAALQAQPEEGIDVAAANRRFFAAWARVWRNQVREPEALRRLRTDPHAPGLWRVNGPLSNLPDFYKAFAVQPGDGMYRPPEARVTIW